jgi:HPt (histidine-containing phosphotransfer) domain-containing protein
MADPTIDAATFAELQATAGADFVRELIDTFLDEAPGMFGELRAAHAAQNAERFRRAAHSLKSNGKTFGALDLAQAARALELGGLPGVNDVAGIDALHAQFERVAAALKALRDER